jgi:protein TonB
MRATIILSFLFLSRFGFAQNEISAVDVEAGFPGGKEAMVNFLQENIIIPNQAIKRRVNGKCYIRFVVSETGNISNVSVKMGVKKCPDCDREAVRVVKSMPDWSPALINGNPVNVWYTLPIVFSIN